ncbi:Uu.00g057360.m01.CDS01 [Anthostomella pinea]|uniref:Uu.00g057360.m01.CDS01 n=1 Tax=Anthostomella pinea TaxID=933095 RepID=A0AAI8VRL5_9PEZI|nr:Uu.00g057360.m01.CDS01 [Anthostomella pinea]
MRTDIIFGLLVSCLAFTSCRADLLSYADELPKCALSCLLTTIPASACGNFTNSTCICTDTDLSAATGACVAASCTVMEQLTLVRTEQEACNIPKRTRRDDIPGFVVFWAVTLLCLAIRLWVRYSTATELAMDDLVVVLMLLVLIAFVGLGQYVRFTAIGFDIWNLDEATVTIALKLFFIDELLYTVVLALCRVGILMFLIRVFSSVRNFATICYIVMAWVVVSAVVIVLMTVFQCWPIPYNWLGWKGEFGSHQCLDLNVLGYVAGGLGIGQDLVILLIPLPVITSLQMPLKRKLFTLFMFSLGSFALAISCIRLRYLVQFRKSRNPTYDYTDAVIWTELEVYVTVIVLCLPSIRTFLAGLMPKGFGSKHTKTPAAASRTLPSGRTGASSKCPSKQYSELESGRGTESIEMPRRVRVSEQAAAERYRDNGPDVDYFRWHGANDVWMGPSSAGPVAYASRYPDASRYPYASRYPDTSKYPDASRGAYSSQPRRGP